MVLWIYGVSSRETVLHIQTYMYLNKHLKHLLKNCILNFRTQNLQQKFSSK